MLSEKLRFVSFKVIENQGIKQRHGRAESAHHEYEFSIWFFFVLLIVCLKTILDERCCCHEAPYLTSRGGSRLGPRFASLATTWERKSSFWIISSFIYEKLEGDFCIEDLFSSRNNFENTWEPLFVIFIVRL